jgi:hypothetical protein
LQLGAASELGLIQSVQVGEVRIDQGVVGQRPQVLGGL